MIKTKQKRNPENKKTLRHLAEFLADAIENHKFLSYLYAEKISQQLKNEDPLFCENCQDFMTLDRIEYHDPQLCFDNIDYDNYRISRKALKEAADDLAENLGIKDYIKIIRYDLQIRQEFEEDDLEHLSWNGTAMFPETFNPINLKYSILKNSDLSNLCLVGANLSGANLSGADLRNTYLTDSNLARADLSGADLSKADLKWSNLYGTNFTNAKITNKTSFHEPFFGEKAIGLKQSNPRKIYSNDKKKKSTIITKRNRK